jgi:NAD(P)-dependent dehydrogenase (short-subunit alcohol dehydrogenase family)
MRVQDKVVIVTGGANGIGRAMCRRFAAEGAKAVVVADIEHEAARTVAAEIGGWDINANVSSESDIQMLVDEVLKRYGQIDLFCSNAGVGVDGDCWTPDRDWLRSWEVNVMGHVYAARAVLPGMLARHEGYLLHTVSTAGRLAMLGSAPYTVTKHAALGLAEWLSITYGDRGIKVSALCPMAAPSNDAIPPDAVAEAVIQGLDAEQFLIAPHPKVLEHLRGKADDYDSWLAGMRRL